MFTFYPISVTWDQARSNCLAQGGDLATIEDSTDQSTIQNKFPQWLVGAKGIWIGYNDRVSESSWAWADGTSLSYTNWYPGEPNDANGEDCVAIYNGPWNDYPCDYKIDMTYVCRNIVVSSLHTRCML